MKESTRTLANLGVATVGRVVVATIGVALAQYASQAIKFKRLLKIAWGEAPKEYLVPE